MKKCYFCGGTSMLDGGHIDHTIDCPATKNPPKKISEVVSEVQFPPKMRSRDAKKQDR